jgi:hypothetical protein
MPNEYKMDTVIAASQPPNQTFLTACKPAVDALLENVNGTVIVMGPTGGGKGDLLWGVDGLLAQSVDYLFERLEDLKAKGKETGKKEMYVSMLDIYKDRDIRDLTMLHKTGEVRRGSGKKGEAVHTHIHTHTHTHTHTRTHTHTYSQIHTHTHTHTHARTHTHTHTHKHSHTGAHAAVGDEGGG